MITNYQAGHKAEKVAADYLRARGFKIQGLNWKTRFCEIDIIAEKGKVMHFIEAKYRARDNQGSGLDYITPYKLKQMRFAAEMWIQENNWRGDYALSVIEISGLDFQVTNFLESIT